MNEVSSKNLGNNPLERLRAALLLAPGEFIRAVATLIYLRWVDLQEAEQEAIAAPGESGYVPSMHARLHWRSYCHHDPAHLHTLFSQDLVEALERLGNCRQLPLATQLHRIAPNVVALGKLPPDTLHDLVRWLSEQPFETQHDRRTLLNVLDSFIYNSPDKHAGQFFTPPTVVQLLVELAAPVAGERVYDPCFGSAGLLTASIDYVQRHAANPVLQEDLPLLQVSGIEINHDAYTIGLTRLALAGVADPQIKLGNSLEQTPPGDPQREGFDLILANPPWGGKVDLHGVDYFPIKTTDSASLFIQHVMSQLCTGGRAVIVIPPSILFGLGAAAELRQMLLAQHTVEAVIALPEETFLPYTNIKSSILLLRRGGPTRSVRMIDGSSIFVPKGAEGGNRLIRSLVSAFIDRVIRLRGDLNSWDIPVEELKWLDWDLTPKRRDQSGLVQILESLSRAVEIRRLEDVCHISSGRSYRAAELQETPPQSNFEPSGQTLFPEVEKSQINPQRPFTFADNPIPYIRIKDVQSGVVSKVSSWLGPIAASSAESKWKLCAGDILLSKSAIFGKTGIVRDGAIGAIASNGFFVLRVHGNIVDPHYLLAYLQSAECNSWLDERTRGSGSRHLPMTVLRGLPVPVPKLQVQQMVAQQHRGHRVDSLAFLADLESEYGGESTAMAIDSWIDGNLVTLDRRNSETSFEADLELLERIAVTECPVNICVSCGKPYQLNCQADLLDSPYEYAKGITTTCLSCWLGVGPGSNTIECLSEDCPLVEWALSFCEATRPLHSIRSLTDENGDLVAVAALPVIQSVRTKLIDAADLIEGQLPNEEKARRLNRGMASMIDRLAASLLSEIKVVVDVLHVSPYLGDLTKVYLEFGNEGRLPLRDLTFETEPALDCDVPVCPYLMPGKSLKIEFTGRLPRSKDSVQIELHWKCRNLAGDRLGGSRVFLIEYALYEARGDDGTLDLGASPYICGDPVKSDRPDVFVGRDELLDQIRRQIVQSGNVVLLEGNRRAGKSSILWHLEGPDAVPGWLGVYCSLQGIEGDNLGGVPTADVFRGIAYQIVQSVRRLNGTATLPDGSILDADRKLGISRALRQGISTEAPFADFREYLELIFESLTPKGLGLLLMLDEFDKLQEGIDNGVTSPQVPENIRYLVQSYPKFSAILTGSRRLKRLREEYWSALFGLGTRFGVTSLPKEPAARLVTEPVRGRLTYSSDAVDLVYKLTAGQPYLLQCLCNRIFDIVARSGVRSVTVDQVQDASKALVEDNEHFASLWDYAILERRRFLLALIHREEAGPDPLWLRVLQERLASHGVDVVEDTLISDLEFLRELELVELHGEARGAQYSLSIPMMGDWIERQQDFEALRSRARAENEDSDE